MRLSKPLIGAALATLLNVGASEASVFTFDFTSTLGLTKIDASGTLTATDLGHGFYDITGISGEVNGKTIDGLTASPFGSLVPTNDLFYKSSSDFLIDFSFDAKNKKPTYEIGNELTGFPHSGIGVSSSGFIPQFTFGKLEVSEVAVSTVPLPASLPMFGAAVLALGGLGLAVRSRSDANSASTAA